MNRVAKRSTIALLLALVLVVGMILFSGEYLLKADDWAVFPGSPHVYTGSNIGCGVITDREGMKNKIVNEISGPPYNMGKPFLLSKERL